MQEHSKRYLNGLVIPVSLSFRVLPLNCRCFGQSYWIHFVLFSKKSRRGLHFHTRRGSRAVKTGFIADKEDRNPVELNSGFNTSGEGPCYESKCKRRYTSFTIKNGLRTLLTFMWRNCWTPLTQNTYVLIFFLV